MHPAKGSTYRYVFGIQLERLTSHRGNCCSVGNLLFASFHITEDNTINEKKQTAAIPNSTLNGGHSEPLPWRQIRLNARSISRTE
jgi:hypothetical protein